MSVLKNESKFLEEQNFQFVSIRKAALFSCCVATLNIQTKLKTVKPFLIKDELVCLSA